MIFWLSKPSSRISKLVLSNQLLLCHWFMTDSYSCINILKILPLFQFYRGHSSVSLTTILRCYPSIQLQFPEVLSSFSLINNSLQKLKLPDYISSVIHKHWGQGLFGGKKKQLHSYLVEAKTYMNCECSS